jgi:hypothetical protein
VGKKKQGRENVRASSSSLFACNTTTITAAKSHLDANMVDTAILVLCEEVCDRAGLAKGVQQLHAA